MSDKPEGSVTIDDADEHSAAIPVEHYHFNIIAVIQEAKRRFEAKTGKEAKYIYAPEPLCYMIDRAIKAKAAKSGMAIPRHAAVVNVHGMEMIVVPGTCTTITAEPLHQDTGSTPPIINAPHPSTVQ